MDARTFLAHLLDSRFCVGLGSDRLAHLISPQCLTQSRLLVNAWEISIWV